MVAVETCLSFGEELIGGRRNLSLLWRGIDWWPQELVSLLERN